MQKKTNGKPSTQSQRVVASRKKAALKMLKRINRQIEKFPEHDGVHNGHVGTMNFLISELTHIHNILNENADSDKAHRS
jgi:hypothetical protein